MNLLDPQTAKWEKLGFNTLISRRELTEVYDPKIVMEDTIDGLIVGIRAYVLTAATGEPQTVTKSETVETKVVATWWDHFKLQYQNSWWMPFKKINWNVRKQTVILNVTVEPRVMFPHAQVSFPQRFGDPVIYYKVDYV